MITDWFHSLGLPFRLAWQKKITVETESVATTEIQTGAGIEQTWTANELVCGRGLLSIINHAYKWAHNFNQPLQR